MPRKKKSASKTKGKSSGWERERGFKSEHSAKNGRGRALDEFQKISGDQGIGVGGGAMSRGKRGRGFFHNTFTQSAGGGSILVPEIPRGSGSKQGSNHCGNTTPGVTQGDLTKATKPFPPSEGKNGLEKEIFPTKKRTKKARATNSNVGELETNQKKAKNKLLGERFIYHRAGSITHFGGGTDGSFS